MADPKADLLAAVAAAGTQGANALATAQQNLATQKQTAITGALASGLAQSAPAAAQAAIADKIGSGYTSRDAALTSQIGTSNDYFSKLGANANVFMDQANALLPAIQEKARLAAASSGGGGGGGGSSSNSFLELAKQLGGQANLQDYIKGQASLAGDPYQARQIAIQLGVPEALAHQWFKYGSAQEAFQGAMPDAVAWGLHPSKGNGSNVRAMTIPQFRKYIQNAASGYANLTPGTVKSLMQMYRQALAGK